MWIRSRILTSASDSPICHWIHTSRLLDKLSVARIIWRISWVKLKIFDKYLLKSNYWFIASKVDANGWGRGTCGQYHTSTKDLSTWFSNQRKCYGDQVIFLSLRFTVYSSWINYAPHWLTIILYFSSFLVQTLFNIGCTRDFQFIDWARNCYNEQWMQTCE